MHARHGEFYHFSHVPLPLQPLEADLKKIEEELCEIDGAEYTKLCGMFALAIPTDLIHRLLVCVAQLVNCSATHQSLSEVLCDRGWPRRLAKVRSSQ